jgi:hypothetical protein
MFKEGVCDREERVYGAFDLERCEGSAREIWVFLASWAPIDESAFNGATDVPHDCLGCSKVNFRWAVV